jgi:putative peptidoglycan lipid II flippase
MVLIAPSLFTSQIYEKLQELLMKKHATLLGISFLVSKILGLIRDNMLAAKFGATAGAGIFNLDTYYAAFRLPDLLYNLLSYGVLSAAFVPLFVEALKKKGEESANRFANEIFHAISGVILLLSIALFLLAPFLTRIFVPGFSPNDFQTTVTLTRIMLATPFLFTLASIAGGIQNARERFLGLSLGPIFYNVGILSGIVFLSETYGVYGVALGVSLGALLNLLVLFPGIFRVGFRYKFPSALWTARVREMITLSLPRIFGMSVTQISLIVNTILASTLGTGSIVIMNFTSNLESLPVGMIGISVAVVSFGSLSGFWAEGKTAEFVREISQNLRRILFLLIPATFGMIALRFQIVSLLLGRGKFSAADIELAAQTLGIFVLGLAFGGIVFLLARGFYAMKETKTPVAVGIAAVLSNILLSLLATKIFHFGTFGLAAANASANIINAAGLFFFLQRKIKQKLLGISEIFKFVGASLVMLGAVEITKSGFENIFLQTGLAILVGAGVYFAVCRMWSSKGVARRIGE